MPVWKLMIEYEGTRYRGWQEQNNVRTVAGEIRIAAEDFLGGQIELAGSGRTDAGVHALAQIAKLKADRAVTIPDLVHGLNDTNVPPTESQQMYDALRALGRSVELLVFDDDGHEIVRRENRSVLVRAMNDWLTAAFAPAQIS